ncbi:MAG: GNAT family N-acetyltransferase [Stagnimonas sp.]|nr:GNAT family N-acetyltransferase [Stagnimonas sp.]
MTELRYQTLLGEQIRSRLEPLAALRLRVFRDWPYLYEGTPDYERRYLETYCRSSAGLAVLVWDGEHCVGATTALPLREAHAEMREPFEAAGIATADILYFGESVVLEDYRGRGIGVRFFEEREDHARRLGLACCVFCAVDRPTQHPLRPAGYLPNDAFWGRRGYQRQPQLVCHFDWQDHDQAAPTSHALSYWLKNL